MALSKDQLIAEQALEIANLKLRVESANKSFDNIRGSIYCIGGPLNDNREHYSKRQMGIFFEIASEAEKV